MTREGRVMTRETRAMTRATVTWIYDMVPRDTRYPWYETRVKTQIGTGTGQSEFLFSSLNLDRISTDTDGIQYSTPTTE